MHRLWAPDLAVDPTGLAGGRAAGLPLAYTAVPTMNDIHRKPLRRRNDPQPCLDPACEGGLCTLCNGHGLVGESWTWGEGKASSAGWSAKGCPHGCPRPSMFYVHEGRIVAASEGDA